MTDHDDSRDWRIADQTMRLLAAAADQDADTCTDILQEVVDTDDAQGVYAVCNALCMVVHTTVFPGFVRGDGSLTGDQLAAVRGGTDDPDVRWAAQFLTAYLNGDVETTAALFTASMHDIRRHVAGVVSLVVMAGAVCRQAGRP